MFEDTRKIEIHASVSLHLCTGLSEYLPICYSADGHDTIFRFTDINSLNFFISFPISRINMRPQIYYAFQSNID